MRHERQKLVIIRLSLRLRMYSTTAWLQLEYHTTGTDLNGIPNSALGYFGIYMTPVDVLA